MICLSVPLLSRMSDLMNIQKPVGSFVCSARKDVPKGEFVQTHITQDMAHV